MPRRPTSRPVARGSFAIAGGVAGFYPIDTPGGWNILGRTAEPIEYRFAPGDVIEIEPSIAAIQETPRVTAAKSEIPGISAPFITRVRAANWSNLERGISVGGPFDIEAAEAANIAVGKAPGEELLGVRADRSARHARFAGDAGMVRRERRPRSARAAR